MDFQFTCKEPDCGLTVTYKPQINFGLTTFLPAGLDEDDEPVYLECPRGHTHQYRIPKSY